MGKAGRWLKSILAGMKDKALRHHHQQQQGDATPLPAAASSPREKKRWSFRRPASAPTLQGKANNAAPSLLSSSSLEPSAGELDQSDHAVAVAVAAAAAADAAVVAAAEAAAEVARLAAAEEESHLSVGCCPVEDEEAAAAAARIQATFRGYLARKALCALRGLVKLQALVRGQLVRRQANATLRRMQALVDAQSRLRRRMLDADHATAAAAYAYQQRRSPQHPRRRSSYDVMDRSSGEDHVKIVEMDVGEPARRGRSSCSAAATESRERRLAEYYHVGGGGQCSPAPSSAAFLGAELSPHRAYSGHFEDVLAFDGAATARSSPYVAPYDAAAAAAAAGGDGYGVVPSYMANTESSRAKARSQSAPRQRTDAALERQPSSRRRGQQGAPSSRKMQRSSSHIGVPAAAACGYGYGYGYGYQHAQPWAGVRLDRSSASMAGSECGSTSSVLTAATVGYCRSLVGFEVQRGHY